MKRHIKIIIIVVVIVLISGIYSGFQVYKMIMGSEPLSGKQENIPPKMTAMPPITKGPADWPNWRGANFEGKSMTKGIKTDWSKGLEKLWKINYLCQDMSTASWSAPVIQGNRLIVPGRDRKNDLVFCINSENGELIWSGSYEAKAESSHGPGSRATPFINEDRVYTYGRSGDLVCWQLENGKLLWRKNVKDVGGVEPSWGFSTTPLIIGNKVIVQGGGNALVIAYEKETGELLWKSMEGEVGYSAAITIIIENEVKVIIYHAKGLSCLNPSDGKVLWTLPWPTSYGVNATTPVVYKDIIFHTSGYNMGCEAIKVTKSGYSVLWKNKAIEAQHSDPILIDGYIYGYSGESSRNAGQFKCLDLSTGKEMWSTNLIGQGTTTFADGYLICQDLKGNLFLVKPEPSGFNKVGGIRSALEDVKNPAWTVPVVANGKLYLRYMQQLRGSANSRGAADMGLYPDLLPGYHRVSDAGPFHEEWGGVPQTAGLTLPQMAESAKAGNLKALYVVGANPVGRFGFDPFAFSKSFVVVQDMFLTETAAIADVVLPAANAYEKSGTFTNTCGDLQLVKKAGEVSNTKPDFEMIVRIAAGMGHDVRKLVPFGRGSQADMGQSRGAQSGEADRHAVWLEAHGLEFKMSPFDPMATLDEIQRLVPGYDVSRRDLLAGNDQHTSLSASGPGAVHDPELIVPANDGLFTSGTLGRYSKTLNSVVEAHEHPADKEVAAD